MKDLHIELPTLTTRASQSVPAIITFIEKIINNGYAYKSNSSVYFDTKKFHQQHSYVTLKADQMNHLDEVNEDKGSSKAEEHTNEKKNERDFVLWTKSQVGELAWELPWGLGRPGAVGCGVRAGSILSKIYFLMNAFHK